MGLAGDKFLVKIVLRERESVQEGFVGFGSWWSVPG